MRAAAFGAAILVASPALAEIELIQARYVCERGVEVPVNYLNADGDSVAVLLVEGRQIVLRAGPTGSGARYVWPSDGSGYVWWSKGDAATLLWRDGASGEETTLLSECVAG